MFPANFILDKVALLWTEQDRSRPQLTVETNGAVIVRVNVAELEDAPPGEPVNVKMYVPGGKMLVVEIVAVEVAPLGLGVIFVGERLPLPHGLLPELTRQTVGMGERETISAMG